jgi:CubicO group peptidase (beta-lactamase class C family)
MAKLGALYLSLGEWNGERIISSDWVQASTSMSTPISDMEGTYGYGYNWWLGRSSYQDRTVDYYCAMGWGGQYIIVYPELDTVVVFTAGGYWEERPLYFSDLLEDYILPAIPQ